MSPRPKFLSRWCAVGSPLNKLQNAWKYLDSQPKDASVIQAMAVIETAAAIGCNVGSPNWKL